MKQGIKLAIALAALYWACVFFVYVWFSFVLANHQPFMWSQEARINFVVSGIVLFCIIILIILYIDEYNNNKTS